MKEPEAGGTARSTIEARLELMRAILGIDQTMVSVRRNDESAKPGAGATNDTVRTLP